MPISTFRGFCTPVAVLKNGDVVTPLKPERFAWFVRLLTLANRLSLYRGCPCPAPGGALSGTLYVHRPLRVQTGVVRSARIPTPGGRSFSRPSALSSNPVTQLYGKPSEAFADITTVTFLTCVLLNATLMRYGLSAGPLPHSVSSRPLAGTSNGPRALRRARR